MKHKFGCRDDCGWMAEVSDNLSVIYDGGNTSRQPVKLLQCAFHLGSRFLVQNVQFRVQNASALEVIKNIMAFLENFGTPQVTRCKYINDKPEYAALCYIQVIDSQIRSGAAAHSQ